MSQLLLLSVFIIAICGLVYELIAGTLASYLLGDSVMQFSTVIGVYLFAMGLGAYVSKFLRRNLLFWFVQTEIAVGFIGGISAGSLFLIFEKVSSFRIILYTFVVIIGMLVGLEIPLLMRILKDRFEFKELVSKVLSIDYLGALVASLLFPLILVPHLGLIQTAFFFGILNVLVGVFTCYLFKEQLAAFRFLKPLSFLVLVLLLLGFAYSDSIVSLAESQRYPHPIVYSKTTPYQRIVLTQEKGTFNLYLNGNLQFSSFDEYRYHEALVHPGLASHPHPGRVLVLGGGDGMAVRELLKDSRVEDITLVDLDAMMTELFQTHPQLQKLNQNSLNSSKVSIINADAFLWLKNNRERFDFVIVDFPDPTNYSLGKLYSLSFYETLSQSLNDDGIAVIQSTSPLFARRSFWCIGRTLQAAGFGTLPYHTYVPSFGEWGYWLAQKHQTPPTPLNYLVPGLRFLTPAVFQSMREFPGDMNVIATEVNQLNNQRLVRYYEEEWHETQQEFE